MFRILDLLDLHLKVNSTHDPVPEFLVNQLFDGHSVDEVNFIEAVDYGVLAEGLPIPTGLGGVDRGEDFGVGRREVEEGT